MTRLEFFPSSFFLSPQRRKERERKKERREREKERKKREKTRKEREERERKKERKKEKEILRIIVVIHEMGNQASIEQN